MNSVHKMLALLLCLPILFQNAIARELIDINIENEEISSCRGDEFILNIKLKNLSNDNSMFTFEITGRASKFLKPEERNFNTNLGTNIDAPLDLTFQIPREVNPDSYDLHIKAIYFDAPKHITEVNKELIIKSCDGGKDFTLEPTSKKVIGKKQKSSLPLSKNIFVVAIVAILFLVIGASLVKKKKNLYNKPPFMDSATFQQLQYNGYAAQYYSQGYNQYQQYKHYR